MKCHNCYDDRTGKGSLIVTNVTFCNDICFDKWKSQHKVKNITPVYYHIMELDNRKYMREEGIDDIYWYED